MLKQINCRVFHKGITPVLDKVGCHCSMLIIPHNINTRYGIKIGEIRGFVKLLDEQRLTDEDGLIE
jgi:hypothetical protein